MDSVTMEMATVFQLEMMKVYNTLKIQKQRKNKFSEFNNFPYLHSFLHGITKIDGQ